MDYFDKWELGNYTESKIWYWYGRMKAWYNFKIQQAEDYLESCKLHEQNEYRNEMIEKIKDWLYKYESENNIKGEYELVKIKHWETWKSLIISIIDIVDNKVKRNQTLEIDERKNPSFFQECCKRFIK